MDIITTKRTKSSDQDFGFLVAKLDLDLNKRYNKAQVEYDKYNKIDLIETVIVAYINNIPVWCGCFKPFDNTLLKLRECLFRLIIGARGFQKSYLGN